jgi:hypothetical protein
MSLEENMKEAIKKIVSFPRSQVCKHWAALQIADAFERSGMSLGEEIIDAIVNSDDETIEKWDIKKSTLSDSLSIAQSLLPKQVEASMSTANNLRDIACKIATQWVVGPWWKEHLKDLKLGDTLLNADNELETKICILNSGYARKTSDGLVITQSDGLGRRTFNLSKKEIKTLAKGLQPSGLSKEEIKTLIDWI